MSHIDSNVFCHFDLDVILPTPDANQVPETSLCMKAYIPAPRKPDPQSNPVLTNEDFGFDKNVIHDPLNADARKVISLTGMTGITKTTIVTRLVSDLETKYLKVNVLVPSITKRNLYNIDLIRAICYVTQRANVMPGQGYVQDRTEYDNLIFSFVHILMAHDVVDPLACTASDLAYVQTLFNKFMRDTGLDVAFRLTSGKDLSSKIVVLVSRDISALVMSMYHRNSSLSSTDKINALNSQYMRSQFYAYYMFAKMFKWTIIDISTLLEDNLTMSHLQDAVVDNFRSNKCVQAVSGVENVMGSNYTVEQLKCMMECSSSDDDDEPPRTKRKVDAPINGREELSQIQNTRIVDSMNEDLAAEEAFLSFIDVELSHKYNISPMQIYFNHLLFSGK